MFSYGSGCAASLFYVRVEGCYKKIQDTAQFKKRLESRIKLSTDEYDKWMEQREKIFGIRDYTPTVYLHVY